MAARSSTVNGWKGGNSSLYSVSFNLANTILGAGLLALPAALSAWGLILGLTGLILAGTLAIFGLSLLSDCGDIVGRPSGFYAVAESACQNLGIVIDFTVAIKCIGVACSYLIVVADSMPLVVGPGRGFMSTRSFWVIVATAAATVPSMLRRMDALKFTSFVALVCLLFITAVVVAFSTPSMDPCSETHTTHPAGHGARTAECGGEIGLLPEVGALAFLKKLSTFVFAYTCHQNIFSLTNELSEPTPTRVYCFIVGSVVASTAIYLTVAICGYFTYGNDVSGDILESYPQDAIVQVARVAISVVVVFSYPLQLHPARASIKSIINFFARRMQRPASPGAAAGTKDEEAAQPAPDNSTTVADATATSGEKSAHLDVICEVGPTFGGLVPADTSMHFLISAAIIGFTFLIALTVTQLDQVLSVVGATGSTTISYILPGVCYFKLGAPGCKRWMAAGLAALGFVIMPTALTVAFIN